MVLNQQLSAVRASRSAIMNGMLIGLWQPLSSSGRPLLCTGGTGRSQEAHHFRAYRNTNKTALMRLSNSRCVRVLFKANSERGTVPLFRCCCVLLSGLRVHTSHKATCALFQSVNRAVLFHCALMRHAINKHRFP